ELLSLLSWPLARSAQWLFHACSNRVRDTSAFPQDLFPFIEKAIERKDYRVYGYSIQALLELAGEVSQAPAEEGCPSGSAVVRQYWLTTGQPPGDWLLYRY